MKKLITSKVIVNSIVVVMLLAAVFAIMGAVDYSYQTTASVGHSPYKSILYSGTANLASTQIGTLYGVVYSIEIEATGVDADGFTLTLQHAPGSINDDVIFSNKFTKFSKSDCAIGDNEYALETTSVNDNVAIGAMFTGDVYLTVSGFDGTAWAVNIIYKSSEPSSIGF